MVNSKAKKHKKISVKKRIIREPQGVYLSKRRPTAVSLFSGCGGMDIGVKKAGFQNIACVELDAHAAETLRFNIARMGETTKVVEGDIRNINPATVASPGSVDLLHGGPPCQAFSLIGKRGSLNDSRGPLLFEMVRFAKELKPRAIMIEQVKGLLSAPDEKGQCGGVFKRFVDELASLGYCVKWTVLCAADFGVPQLRERVFIVAFKDRNGFFFPAPAYSADPEETPLFSLKPYVGVGSVIADIPEPVAKGKEPRVPNHVDVTPDRDRERIGVVPEGSFLAAQLDAPKELRCNLTKKDTTKYRRLHRMEPSLTLRCGEIFFHPTEDRYLTPREYMRIHGYPDEYILVGPVRSRSGVVKSLDQHRMVANSVPPPLADAVAKQIAKVLS